jgi:NAD(P)-dependent dehydrogenase (short-subunit alcohol dehydrogenase family)
MELARTRWTLVVDARDAENLELAVKQLGAYTKVYGIAGDVGDAAHRSQLACAAEDAGGLDALVNNASVLGISPQPPILEYPLDALERVYRVNTLAPLALLQTIRHLLRPGARVINVTSDAAVVPYPGWGGYGSSKAALEQWSAVLAAESPSLKVYWVDPGDMRTRLHQEAFPDQDISDRPPPEDSIPGVVRLLEDDLPSGRYEARVLASRVNA